MMSINNNRKWIAVFLAFCMFALAACGGAGAGGSSEQAAKTETETEAEPAAEPSAGSTTEEMVGMINPWTETMDLEEAKKATGIDFEPPVENSLPEGYDLVTYRYVYPRSGAALNSAATITITARSGRRTTKVSSSPAGATAR